MSSHKEKSPQRQPYSLQTRIDHFHPDVVAERKRNEAQKRMSREAAFRQALVDSKEGLAVLLSKAKPRIPTKEEILANDQIRKETGKKYIEFAQTTKDTFFNMFPDAETIRANDEAKKATGAKYIVIGKKAKDIVDTFIREGKKTIPTHEEIIERDKVRRETGKKYLQFYNKVKKIFGR